MLPERIIKHSDLVGFEIIITNNQMDLFLKETKTEDPRKSLLIKDFRKWKRNQSASSNFFKFFAILNEPDDFVQNDNWGSWHIKKCVAIPVGDGKYEIFFKDVDSIPH